jgi:hypothetical protein
MVVVIVLGALCGGARANEPDIEPAVLKLPPPSSLEVSYLVPALEIASLNLGFNAFVRMGGADYAQISPRSMWRNVGGGWDWDDDYFTTNQFRHPYMGALFYTSARSNRVGFWGSAAYAFMGSLMWEVLMETERPSLNDQISTPLGGVILGEAMHRFSNALLWNEGYAPEWWRQGLSALVSPMSALNRNVLGTSSRVAEPPPSYSSIGIGYNMFSDDSSRNGMSRSRLLNQLHLALSASYGLPGSTDFEPDDPMDHLDVVAEVDVSEDDVFATLFMRGLAKGRTYGEGRLRGLWGVFTSYDFFNPDRLRVGAISIGLGTSAQVRVGDKGFVQGTAIYSAVPFGAAGTLDSTDIAKNYHWGPGSSQLFEVRIGRADTGAVKLTSRTFEILGAVFNEGTELVSYTTLSGQLSIWGRHSIGAELVGSVRRATFDDESLNLTDTGAQARIFYTLVSDTTFGGVLDD